MDCDKLNQSLEGLRKLRDDLRSKVDFAIESGAGKQEIITAQQELSSLSDSILAEYLPDFGANFPGLTEWKPDDLKFVDTTIQNIFSLSDNQFAVAGTGGELRIFSLRDGEWKSDGKVDGFGGRVNSIAQLQDNQYAVGGEKGQLKFFTLKNGRWEHGEVIAGFRTYDYILAITQISDDQLAVGGGFSELDILTLKDNKWEPSKKFTGFYNKGAIDVITKISDNQFVIGGRGGMLRIFTLQNGEWEPSEEIAGLVGEIKTIISLSNDQFVISGDRDKIKIFTLQDGEWEPGEEIIGFDGYINAIAQLSDNLFVAGGTNYDPKFEHRSVLRFLTKTSDGKWEFSEKINAFDNIIYTITRLSNNQFVVGGEYRGLRVLTSIPPTLEDLKQAIAGGKIT